MSRVKVRSTMNIIGLKAGQQAEIDLTQHVVGLLRSGYLVLLRPKNG